MVGHEAGHHRDASKEALEAGHEVDEIHPRPIISFLVGLTIFSAVSFAVVFGLFKYLAHETARTTPRASALAPPAGTRQPPEPRLQVDAWGDWDSYKAAQDELLHSYGWVDKDSLIVRIPVERAMELMLERGLPARGERLAPPTLRLRPPDAETEPAPAGSAPAGGHH